MNKRVFRVFTLIVVAASLMATAWPTPALAAPSAVPARSLPTSAATAPVPPAAPAADYTFSSSSGTYTEISGGTTYGTATNDDQSFNAINIGFPFSFSGPSYTTVYTQVSVQSNGFIAMGPSVVSSYTPLNTGSSNNVISALGRDLQGQATGVITAELSSLLQGTTPNRTFTIQWKHYKAYGSPNVGDDFNYQIVLHETTNVIDVIYGNFVVTNTKTVQTGLRGNTNADFNNRTTTTSWTASAAGATNADTMALTTSVYPPSGLRYTFTPPPARPFYGTSTKAASAGTVSGGQLLTYTINLRNTGDLDGVGTTLVDPIPTGTSFVSIVTPPEATYNAGQNRVEWTGTVSQSIPLNVTFVVTVTGAGLPCPATITNTATISQPVLVAPVALSASTAYWNKPRYAEDFELGAGGYITSGVNSSWAYGTPTSGPGAAHSGTNLWATNLAGNYNASENSYLESPVMDLHSYVPVPGYPLYLGWWQWQYTESGYDYFSVDVSNNGGASWTTVYGPIAGSYQSWQNKLVDISAYATANSKFRFHFTSDSSAQYAGMYIDDVSIQNCTPPRAIYVIPAAQTGQACPAGNTGYQFNVLNLADELGVIAAFSQDSGVGSLGFSPMTMTVGYGPSNAGIFTATHTIPSYLFDGQSAAAVLRATAGSYSSTAQITTTAGNSWLTAQAGGAPTLWPGYANGNTAFYYIDGKDTAGNPTNRVQIFTPNVGWTAGMTHTAPASFGGVAGYNTADGKVYYASGFGTGMVGNASFAAYDPVANTWASLPAKPQAFGLGAGGVTSNGVFVWAGGSPNSGFIGTTPVYTYSIATNTWYTGTALNTVGFTAPGYVMVGNKLYVGGSYFGSSAFYAYDVTANTWTQLADLPAGAGKVSPLLISAAGGIYLIGGGNSPAVANATTWRYDIASNTWDTFTPLPTAVIGSGGGLLSGELYVFGGGSNTTSARSPAPHYKNIAMCTYPNLTSLTGRVINGVTSSGIPSATVSALGLREISAPRPIPSTTTDASGYYTLTLSPAVYNVTAAKSPFDSKTDVVTVTVSGATQNFVLGPAAVAADPTSFNVTAHYSETVQRTMVVTNSGYSNLNLQIFEANGGFTSTIQTQVLDVETQSYRMTEPQGKEVVLSLNPDHNSSIQATPPPPADVNMIVDDGQAEDAIGLTAGGQFVWFNRFTPALADFPFQLTKVAVMYDMTGAPLLPGDNIELVVWEDKDGDNNPGTNAVFKGSKNVTVLNKTDWNIYEFNPPIQLNGPGDVLIGLVNRSGASGKTDYPANIDQNSAKARRSWIGSYGGNPPDPPTLPAPNNWGIIDDFGSTLAGNWTVRGYGMKGGEIPWLTEYPTQTVLLPGTSALVTLTFDAKKVSALGVYTGSLILRGGTQPITVPVQMNVVDNLSVTPTRLERTLQWGQTGNDLVDLANLGTIPVNYQITNLPLKRAFLENFDAWTAKDAPPAGWTITRTAGVCSNGNSLPQWQSSAVTGRATFGSGYYAAADVDRCGSGSSMNTALFSPPIDLTTAALARLNWNNYYRPLGTSDRGYLDITTNGGVSWTRLVTYTSSTVGPAPVELDLTPYVGKVVQLRFWYIAPAWDWYWYVDDLTVWVNDPWLSTQPMTGTVSIAATAPVTFTYDTTQVLQPGDYNASPYLISPDIKGNRAFSVTLHVVPAANSAHLAGTILGNRTISGTNQPLKSAMVNVIGPAPVMLSAAADGSYGWWFTGAQTGTYTVTISYPGYVPQTNVLAISNGVTTTNNATLILDAPFLNANPEAIADVLPWGGSIMHTLTVSNPAPAYRALNATLAEIAGSYTPPIIQTVQVNIPAKTNVQRAVNAQAFAVQSTRAAQNRTIVIDNLALGKIKVLLVSSDWSVAGDLGGMDMLLAAYPDLQVDIYPMEHIPTLAELTPYTVVVIGSQYTWESTFDHNALGDVMADYVDAGGKVIQAFGTMHGAPSGTWYWALGGRWQSQAYSPMTYSTFYNLYQTRSLGVYLAGHPLMQGVNSIVDMFVYGGDITVRPDAQAVAFYDNGVPYLATYPGRVVALNEAIFNAADWQGDLPTLLHNAILYLAPGDVPWLSETTTQFNLAIGASATTNVTLDSAVPQVNQPGTYRAWLWINHNDPLQVGSYIPVQMDVSPAATMARLAGTISSDRPGGSLANAQAVVKGPAGTFTYTTGADGKFGRWFTAAQAGTYTITATAAGYVTSTTTANLTSGVTTTAPIALKLDAPWITEAPSALSVTLVEGNKLTQTVTINNFGQRDLTYQFIEFPPTATLPVAIKTIANNEPLVIEPELQAKLAADGSTGYLIYFRERPDLSAAYDLDWQARGQFVMNALKATADRSQAATRAYLNAQGADYQGFWIDNVIVVKQSSLATFNGLTSRPEIAALRMRRTMYPIDANEEALAAAIPTTVESNIAHVKAPEVWAMGYTGQGVVVSSIDTGVRYTHQALNAKYRGNLGGGTYDHNYNWWDPYGDHPTAPADDNGHGSHTMGLMVGDDGGANQIGMAPGAKWIAARGCNTSNCTDAALLEAAQWIAAPWNLAEANPDPSKRPNVVNNSWGDCGRSYDPWYRGVVDSWQAAGIYPVFSNGNASNCGYPEPPGLNTVGNPARYGNVTGVGATTQNTGEYATYSNWGPTDNPDTINPRGHPDLKPQVLAPGTARSSVNSSDSAYGVIGGTSMSAPHVVGLIALMWSAAPCMVGDYATTETIIEETAIPIPYNDGTGGGAHVPNYATGWGEINALAAVIEAQTRCLVDVPWIQEVPVTGTVASLGSQGVAVVFNSTGLTAGVYTATLQINHNDPLGGKVRIPVTMTVQAYQPTFTVIKTVSPSDRVVPGGVLTYTITIQNGGRDSTLAAVTDWVPANTTYIAGSATGGLLFIDPPANPATWDNTLASGADHVFTFRVQVDPSAIPGTVITNTVTVAAYGQTYVSTAVVPVNVAPVTQYKIYLPIVRR